MLFRKEKPRTNLLSPNKFFLNLKVNRDWKFSFVFWVLSGKWIINFHKFEQSVMIMCTVLDIDECTSQPCAHLKNTKCKNTPGYYTCVCKDPAYKMTRDGCIRMYCLLHVCSFVYLCTRFEVASSSMHVNFCMSFPYHHYSYILFA